MMKKIFAGMMAMTMTVVMMTTMAAGAYYSDETYYYGTYENMIEMRDEGTFKCSATNMKKLASIYTDDDTNDLIEAYKGTYVRTSDYAGQIICMVGYEVDGYYFYRTYMMTAKTYDTEALEVTDVSMKWHCIKFDKIEDCYDWHYC